MPNLSTIFRFLPQQEPTLDSRMRSRASLPSFSKIARSLAMASLVNMSLTISVSRRRNLIIQRLNVKSLMFVQSNGKRPAVLVGQIFVDDKGYCVNFAFNVVVFAFVNAQPEHEFRFSAGAHFGFAHAHYRLFVVLCGKKRAQLARNFVVHGDLYHEFLHCAARDRSIPRGWLQER
jgi:hypothetical protein